MYSGQDWFAYEKLGAGVSVLTTQPGPIKARLIAAFIESLLQVRSATSHGADLSQPRSN